MHQSHSSSDPLRGTRHPKTWVDFYHIHCHRLTTPMNTLCNVVTLSQSEASFHRRAGAVRPLWAQRIDFEAQLDGVSEMMCARAISTILTIV